MNRPPVEYTEYLQLDRILNSQAPESDKENISAHDEMLFIIIHQAYELWFKQIHHELDSALQIMNGKMLNDNSPELQTIVHRMNRVGTILNLLVHQIDILETMTPLDFHDFRDLLRPASGFQSWQFKMIEAKLGLKFDNRHGQQYYLSQLKPQFVEMIKEVEKQPTLLELIDGWLSRMPFFDSPELWENYKAITSNDNIMHPFWSDFINIYESGLVEGEKQNIETFKQIFFSDSKSEYTSLSSKAMRSALFISLYRGYPILHMPFNFMNAMVNIDEQMATWRFRHINMVHRMIGNRVGTGGSSGKDYLQGALNKHYIFKDFAILSSFLIERHKLPVLSQELELRLGFYRNA
ncbi:MAG: tryptophan 2,3-dioxygenase [Bacteroidetes bacterium]|nr:tryptophan 2,3-dioxygenase [Bacteroidota bacterium]MBP7398431.1 tryptophan 2,3-dioxygenase [Chitinophagales bacterium]MBK7109213.1 tryptophan 2,3-dioxygenase [Bacteroidota bacterium]MBK8488466.1 tryptophan 2,3-dioxygenase [Bacteroidota bacterium]MBK8681771.1 tryptophan 2,3-dioxygenase [Bacteroidota bacterium]